MSIITLFSKRSPLLNGYSFDAVLEDSFEASIELTRYPVESGIQINDHRIVQPMKYYLTGIISNNELKPSLTDFAGGTLSNLIPGSGIAAAVAGMSAGYLAGNTETRASSALEALIQMMILGEPFDVDAVDVQLQNMVITKISRERNPENENSLIFVAELQELIQLDRLSNSENPNQSQLPDGDPAKSSAASGVNRGQQTGSVPDPATAAAVEVMAVY